MIAAKPIVTSLAVVLAAIWAPVSALGQATSPPPATAPTRATPGDAPVPMEFPTEGIELRTLADIVTKRLKIPILYDEQINTKTVIIRVPVDVPESALLGVLQSALRMKGFALVDAEQPGWKQIVPAQSLAAVAKPKAAGAGDAPPGEPIVQAFVIHRSDPATLAEAVRPYLTQPGGTAQPVPGQRTLIVTDYPSAVRRAGQLIELLDSAAPVETKFLPLKQADAVTVAAMVNQILSGRESARGGAPGATGAYVAADERGNQIILAAPPERIEELTALIDGMDKPVERTTKVYRLKSVAPDRVDRVIRDLVGSGARHSYQASVDPESQALVVAATADVHASIDAVLAEIDKPVTEERSPIQFYKLKNSRAADVLATIAGLLGGGGEGESAGVVPDLGGTDRTESMGRAAASGAPLSRSDAAAPANAASQVGVASAVAPKTPSRATEVPGVVDQSQSSGVPGFEPAGGRSVQYYDPSTNPRYRDGSGGVYPEGLPSGPAFAGAVRGKNATVAADANTNSIIVIARPSVQQQYAQLIQMLDRRRPQVQVECTIVTLDTANGATIGIDVARLGGYDNGQIISFGSFGVATVDPVSGSLTPVAAPGGTFALLSPKIADIVVRGLSTNSKARLVSAPQLLVNDNGKGRLQSVSQEPFAEILDTSTTQSRTGLGGQAQAGTTISVEPHISEGDYLQLTYAVELSSFTGQSTAGLPPPSQKNAIESMVTIPDGYTIVVGGLSVKNFRATRNSIPILDQIPIIKELIGSRSRTDNDTTLFVFIRPVILRDDKFEDLKYLSEKKAKLSDLPSDFPTSEPVPMH